MEEKDPFEKELIHLNYQKLRLLKKQLMDLRDIWIQEDRPGVVMPLLEMLIDIEVEFDRYNEMSQALLESHKATLKEFRKRA